LLNNGWGPSSMFTEFFRPADLTAKRVTETTFVIEKKLTERLSLFTEYVGDYPQGFGPILLLNSGGMYHLTPNQQVDFHVAFGLNQNSPTMADIGRFICHPGGARVVSALETALSLHQGALDHERQVIADFGNMSAPSVLFVLERARAKGLPVRSLLTALGPGFTASCVALRHTA
jgi:alkylresorcinol/alkylpyrone synthase